MEEKTEAVKSEETTVGLTMNYNPFSFISCQEDALVLAGCISHGLDADVIKKSGDLFATARAMLLDACVCLLYRQGSLIDFSDTLLFGASGYGCPFFDERW